MLPLIPDTIPTDLRRHDRDRFLATLFAAADRQPELWALLAFNLEIARVREVVSQPILGQIRLQWWRDMLDEAYGDGPLRRHIVATPLADAIRTRRIPRFLLDAMIDGRERDLDEAPPASLAVLEDYADATSAKLLQAMLVALGVTAPAASEAATHVGIAWALVGLIRAIPFHAAAQRIYIPVEIAQAADLHEADIVALKPSAALSHAVRQIAAAAEVRLSRARALRRNVPRSALPALLPARIAAATLKRLARTGYDPYAPQIQQPDPLAAARLWLGWQLRRY